MELILIISFSVLFLIICFVYYQYKKSENKEKITNNTNVHDHIDTNQSKCSNIKHTKVFVNDQYRIKSACGSASKSSRRSPLKQDLAKKSFFINPFIYKRKYKRTLNLDNSDSINITKSSFNLTDSKTTNNLSNTGILNIQTIEILKRKLAQKDIQNL